MIRSFVAIALPPALIDEVSATVDELKRLGIHASFSKPGSVHLTLKFLGDVEETDITSIAAALAQIASEQHPFDLEAQGIGVFPNRHSPRVVWMGISTAGAQLRNLQQAVERSLEPVGFPLERRPFSPHLTLARVKSRANLDWLSRFVADNEKASFGSFSIDAFHLYQSILRPEGAEYRRLCSFPLEGA